MKFTITTIIALSLGILSSCRTAAHADSTFMGGTNSDNPLLSRDCEVWRFYLFNTLAAIIHQSKVHERPILYERMLEIDKNAKFPPYPPPIHKLLPAHRARKIIDTVLALEKGVCSRELLYETPCRALPTGGKRKGGIVHNHAYDGYYKSKYFSDVMGIPMHNLLAISYEKFLLNHLSKSPESKIKFHLFGCPDPGYYTCNRETINLKSLTEFSFNNNAGLCLLMKHHDYLKENNLLDLRSLYTGKIYTDQLIAEDLDDFIKKSYEIQEAYSLKDSDNK